MHRDPPVRLIGITVSLVFLFGSVYSRLTSMMTDEMGPSDVESPDLGMIVIASTTSSLSPEQPSRSNAIPGNESFELLAEAYVGPRIFPTRARVNGRLGETRVWAS